MKYKDAEIESSWSVPPFNSKYYVLTSSFIARGSCQFKQSVVQSIKLGSISNFSEAAILRSEISPVISFINRLAIYAVSCEDIK